MYTMTTVRLSKRQKKRLESGRRLLESLSHRKWSRGEVVERLAEFALDHRDLLASSGSEETLDRRNDPFFDLSIVFPGGPTDERTIDRVLYGLERE